ncbi:MAG: hypothetical protein K5753_04215, partial [Clostridia bacterium]|nr:hypothetical protein [Clostridia bacterium]
KTMYGPIQGYSDRLDLFRVALVKENIRYERKRLFHTPYNLRSKVATCRYSIAGYPSLYLGTDLELCCEEVQYDPHSAFGIASRFRIERDFDVNDTEIRVIELAIKPQDFFKNRESDSSSERNFDEIDLYDAKIKEAYCLWYPLIAACSFIRANKNDPFAAEYIVPQLLMQWVRLEMDSSKKKEKRDRRDEDQDRCYEDDRTYEGRECHKELVGVRYFSCVSERASDLGFNYVFPVSGDEYSKEFPFCPVLMKSFKMTKPYFINNYASINMCESEMKKDQILKYVN